MKKIAVTVEAVREFVKESLEADSYVPSSTSFSVADDVVVDPSEIDSIEIVPATDLVTLRSKGKRCSVDDLKATCSVVAGVKDFGGGQILQKKENKVEDNISKLIKKIAAEAIEEANALPFGFGKGKFTAGGTFRHPDDEEEGPQDDYRARGFSADDEFKADGTVNFNPDDDIIDPEEQEAALAKLTKSSWDPEDEEEEEEEKVKASPRKRVDLGKGYGVDGDTYDVIGDKFGWTKEGAKKAIETALERFKVLHDMDPEELNDMLLDGADEYIDTLAKTGELDDEEVDFMRKNSDKVMDSDAFREFFSKYVKRAVRDLRADNQDAEDD